MPARILIEKPTSLTKTLWILKVTLESGYQNLGNEAFLDIRLFMKMFFLFFGFYTSCRILSELICYTLYIYI